MCASQDEASHHLPSVLPLNVFVKHETNIEVRFDYDYLYV